MVAEDEAKRSRYNKACQKRSVQAGANSAMASRKMRLAKPRVVFAAILLKS